MTDREKAAQYRTKLQAVLAPVCNLVNEAMADGFLLNYNTGPDANGNQIVTKIEVLQKL